VAEQVASHLSEICVRRVAPVYLSRPVWENLKTRWIFQTFRKT